MQYKYNPGKVPGLYLIRGLRYLEINDMQKIYINLKHVVSRVFSQSPDFQLVF
jgi:hypothetical protein